MTLASLRKELRRWARKILLLPLRGALALADLLGKFLPRRLPGQPSPAPGLSILIPERANAELLGGCLDSLAVAARDLAEPVEVIVVVNGSPRGDYAELERRYPAVRWRFFRQPLGFSAAIRKGLQLAQHGWVYLLNNDMVLAPDALRELLPWRAPRVFAIGSQIFFKDPGKRREETGLGAMRIVDGRVEAFEELPDHPDVVRTSLYASGGSSLFQRELLTRMVGRRDPYAPFYWEDAEWGARAHAEGYGVLFCPRSIVWHHHRATVGKVYAPDEVERIFQRHRLLFHLRNLRVLGDRRRVREDLRAIDWASFFRVVSPAQVFGVFCSQLRAATAPFDDGDLIHATAGRLVEPASARPGVPTLLVVSPYGVLPPRHGSAVRLHALVLEMAKEFRVVLVSDEGAGYAGLGAADIAPFAAVHPVMRTRWEPSSSLPPRVARIESHSRPELAEALRRRALVDGAALVQVEHVELAGLVRDGKLGLPWVLHLHDVTLSEGKRGPEDHFEEALIARHDAVVVCSGEDAALLGHPRVAVVPNGAAVTGYLPSPDPPRLLFIGPFRYAPNREGLQLFLARAFPAIRERVPGVELHVLSGTAGAPPELLRQPGVVLHELSPRPREFLDRTAVTINPLLGIRGSPLKLVESLVAGRVCVSTREGARGFLGLEAPGLVVVEGVEDFVEPLVRLLTDAAWRRSLERPTAAVLQACSWSRCAGPLIALLREVSR